VEADVPGIEKEAVSIYFDSNYLTVSTKREDTIEDKKKRIAIH